MQVLSERSIVHNGDSASDLGFGNGHGWETVGDEQERYLHTTAVSRAYLHRCTHYYTKLLENQIAQKGHVDTCGSKTMDRYYSMRSKTSVHII